MKIRIFSKFHFFQEKSIFSEKREFHENTELPDFFQNIEVFLQNLSILAGATATFTALGVKSEKFTKF